MQSCATMSDCLNQSFEGSVCDFIYVTIYGLVIVCAESWREEMDRWPAGPHADTWYHISHKQGHIKTSETRLA